MYYIELEIGLGSFNPRFEFKDYDQMYAFIKFFLDQGYSINVRETEEK